VYIVLSFYNDVFPVIYTEKIELSKYNKYNDHSLIVDTVKFSFQYTEIGSGAHPVQYEWVLGAFFPK
jgi:hypothetical protein